MSTPSVSYKRHRFPPKIIAHAVWLYCRFNLSFREVEEVFLKRGVDVSYKTIRRWVAKFAPVIARGLRRRQSQPGDIWHLDEVVVTIKGRKQPSAVSKTKTRTDNAGLSITGSLAVVRIDPFRHPELLLRSCPSPLCINNSIPPTGSI